MVAVVPDMEIAWTGDIGARTWSGCLSPSPAEQGRTAAAGEPSGGPRVEQDLEGSREVRSREATERGQVSMTFLCARPHLRAMGSPGRRRQVCLHSAEHGRWERRLVPARLACHGPWMPTTEGLRPHVTCPPALSVGRTPLLWLLLLGHRALAAGHWVA